MECRDITCGSLLSCILVWASHMKMLNQSQTLTLTLRCYMKLLNTFISFDPHDVFFWTSLEIRKCFTTPFFPPPINFFSSPLSLMGLCTIAILNKSVKKQKQNDITSLTWSYHYLLQKSPFLPLKDQCWPSYLRPFFIITPVFSLEAFQHITPHPS